MTELNLKKTQQSYCHHKNCDNERMEIMSKDRGVAIKIWENFEIFREFPVTLSVYSCFL